MLWAEIENAFLAKQITLREALEREAAFVKLDRESGMLLWDSIVNVEPGFTEFVHAQRARGAQLTIVSAGIETLIRHVLAQLGLHDLPVIANDVEFDPNGWRFKFIDDSPWGLYKERYVQAARARGAHTIYIGDGISDYQAIHAAERRFAKRGRSLERYLEQHALAFTPFARFAEIGASL